MSRSEAMRQRPDSERQEGEAVAPPPSTLRGVALPPRGTALRKNPRELPRNERRAALRSKLVERRETTPTPAPVEVSTDEPTLPASTTEAPAARPSRLWTLGFLVLTALSLLGLRRASESVPLSAHVNARGLFAMVVGAIEQRGAAAAHLVGGAAPAEAPSEPAVVPLRRDGHVSIPGGILVLPKTFQPDEDGSYDLYLHFHGNTGVVRESAEVANLNAAVAIVNLGIGSAPYEEMYAVPGTYEELLATINAGLERRGLEHPQLRRVALGGWSAGYGAISTIMQVRKKNDRLDAILVFDGIHCGWEGGELNARQMRPFVDAAQLAADGSIFFGITHSTIDPKAYASTSATADYLLGAVGAERAPLDPVRHAPPYLELESMRGAVAKRLEKTMEPTSEARLRGLHVIGYRGDTKEHHMAHLFQMGSTLLPELVARWGK